MTGFDQAWLEKHRARMAAMGGVAAVSEGTHDISVKQQRHSAGVRPDIGPMHFRSKWEANFARYLNLRITWGEIVSWRYEPTTFWFLAIKRGVRSYVPDFYVTPSVGEPYYIELKGFMDSRSKTKIKRMRIYHPNVKMVVVPEDEYLGLARTVRPLIPSWE